MDKTMIASGMTDGQIENAVGKLRDALRKHRDGIASSIAQQVLGVENIGMEMFVPFRNRVEAVSSMIVRHIHVDRTRTPQQVVDATSHKQYVDKDILATMPQGEDNEVDVYFVPTKRFVPVKEVSAFLAQYGLVPDPRAQAAVNEADPTFADEHPNGTQWGDNCYLTFYRWIGGRRVYVLRSDDDWSDRWFLSGVPAPRK